MTGYYRDCIPSYGASAAPLSDLTRKGNPNVPWDVAQDNALKASLATTPILKLPDTSKPFVLRCDASKIGLGAMLLQDHDRELFLVSYASKKLTDTEKRYCTIERECLAIVWAIKKFRVYLYGVEFVLQTDHQALQFIDRTKYDTNKVMRWALFLQNYHIKYQCTKGKDCIGSDCLSRLV